MNISNAYDKDKILKNAFDSAIDLKSYNIASLAIKNTSNTNSRDNMLDTAIEKSVSEGSLDKAVDLLHLYSSSSRKEKAANIIYTTIQNSP